MTRRVSYIMFGHDDAASYTYMRLYSISIPLCRRVQRDDGKGAAAAKVHYGIPLQPSRCADRVRTATIIYRVYVI